MTSPYNWATEFRSQNLDGNTVDGYASVWNQYAKTRVGMENIHQRAFDRALETKQDVRLLRDHNPSMLLARTASGTLQLRTDDQGLHVNADLPNTSYANDMKELMRRGDLTQMSFGFVPTKDKWTSGPGGMQVRTITDLNLHDVSIVTMPAYSQTSVQLRSMEEIENQPGDLESVASQLIKIRHSIYLGGIRK
jgi:hypothetical protein